ncbi:hypothetical protein BGZ76_006004 [Entomortierella beljakovae]|nr:hypothetical protein BGZ76_006004 [Entomortierella beljakovae]
MVLPTPTQASSDVLSQAAKSKNNSTYKVLYFEVHGRGELTRTLLAYSGAKWSELTVDWANQKQHTPFQVLPVVYETTTDGTVLELAESPAIERYFADKFDLNGKNEYEKHKVDQVVSSVEAAFQVFANKVTGAPIDSRLVEINKFYNEVLPKFIQVHEERLKKNGSNGHYVGDSITFADIKLAAFIGRIQLFRVKGSDEPPFSAEKTPLLWKVYETVYSNPNLKAWKNSERYQAISASTLRMFKFD